MSEITQELSALSGFWNVIVRQVTLPISGQSQQLCQANPLRWGLIIAASFNGNQVMGFMASSVPVANGILSRGISVSGSYTIALNYRDNPGLVQAAWYAASYSSSIAVASVYEEIAIQ